MYSATHEITVDASIERIVQFLETPRSHCKVVPGLLALETVRPVEDEAWRGQYVYKLAGVQLEGTIRTVNCELPTAMDLELSGAIDGEVRVRFDMADGEGVTIAVRVEYDLPETILAAVPEATATAYVRRELECTLGNLKTHLGAIGAGSE
jgi:hypothetical protein